MSDIVSAKEMPDGYINGGLKENPAEFIDLSKKMEFKPGVGVDVGTCNIAVCRETTDGKYMTRTHRNILYPLDINDGSSDLLDRSDYLYVKSGTKYYIVGEDALRVFNAIGTGSLIRPMQDGVLNPNLKESSDLLFFILKACLGNAVMDKEPLRFSQPSQPVNKSFDTLFHKMVLTQLFNRANYSSKEVAEAMAVAYDCNPILKSETGDVPLSSIAISLGGGMANIALLYKGLELNSFSVTQCGDYIDNKVQEATGMQIGKIISTKEKKLDLGNIDYNDRIQVALGIYYEEMMDRVIHHMSKHFINQKSELDGELEIVVAGGSSMPKSFIPKFEEKIKASDFPFKVYRVRHADNPFYSVSQGCCIRAQADYMKSKK